MKLKRISIILLIIFIIGNLLPIYSFSENETVIKEDIFNDITAPNLLLAETDSDRILYERKIDERIYPASLTKLMTAILVVENCDLNEKVTVSENAVISVPAGYVNANLQVGEELTVKDLLYAMLIPSANDAANVLAEHVAGSIESFASMMNTKAKELGCIDSNFTNPSGLHEKQHYTTTRDLYYISQKAISNELIRKILGTTSYTLPKTNQYKKADRIFTTTNYMKRKELSKYYYEYCIGAKTGYTGDAKNCVIAFAEKDGVGITAIVMGENAKIKGKKFLDAKEMFEYVFKHYKIQHTAIKNQKYETIKINNGTKETKMLDVLYNNDIYLLNNHIEEEVQTKVEYYHIKAPIQKGECIGKITYLLDGKEYSTDLIAKESVDESKILRNIFYLLVIVLIIYIIYNIKKSKKNYTKGKKNYYQKRTKRIHY